MADIVVTTGGNSVTNGTNFQTALDAATPGDRVILTAGATYDGTFTLADKGASEGSPVTITTDATLPNRRIGPSDSALLARVRTLGTGGSSGSAFEAPANSGWWIIDGLEITDNAADDDIVNTLLFFQYSTNHNITIKRCWMHNKETGTDYYRNIRFAVQFEGNGLLMKWNYIFLLGYYQLATGSPDFYPLDTEALLSSVGNTITVDDNYLDTWYNAVFLGGADAPPVNTATLTSASTTAATFSNVTGITAGLIIRLDVVSGGTAVVVDGTATITLTSGATLTSADEDMALKITAIPGNETAIALITDITAGVITATAAQGIPNGSVSLLCYQTAIVDSVAGSVVNYTPYGHDILNHTPSFAAWNYGDQGMIYDVEFTRNTFNIDVDFATDVLANNGNHPKGAFEIKSVKRFLLEGNIFSGFPGAIGASGTNQSGTAPWTVTSDMTLRNNWMAPINHELGYAIIIDSHDDLHTVTPTTNVLIENNFITHLRSFYFGGADDILTIRHNTIVNDGIDGGYNAVLAHLVINTNFSFIDNIVSYLNYGMVCLVDPGGLATCFPSGIFANNVVVDTLSVGFTSTQWGSGGILTPIPATFDDVGFVNVAANNYELDVLSDYKGAASDSADPGANWGLLRSALSSDAYLRMTKKGNTTRGRH